MSGTTKPCTLANLETKAALRQSAFKSSVAARPFSLGRAGGPQERLKVAPEGRNTEVKSWPCSVFSTSRPAPPEIL